MSQPGEEWTDWVWKSITIDTNCREIIDNVVDMAHFFYVHYGFPIKFKNIFEGHVATQYYEGVGREDMRRAGAEEDRLRSETTPWRRTTGRPSWSTNSSTATPTSTSTRS